LRSPAESGTGNKKPRQYAGAFCFGPITKASVIAFQKKYAKEVLVPWRLTEGTFCWKDYLREIE